MIKFIHAADLHLDTPFTGFKHLPESWKTRLKEAPYHALKQIVKTAISEKVDFVIFSGDIYDQETRGFKAQIEFQNACEKLGKAGVKTFVIFGNHDFSNQSLIDLNLPDSVYVFPQKVTTTYFETSSFEKVALTGFSFWARHIHTPVIEEFPYRDINVDYHIGVYHGQIGKTGDPYAPFQVKDMQRKQYDYWALGHIHQFQQLSTQPPIVYSGTTQGRHPLEVGEKGIHLVTMDGDSYHSDFIATQDIQFLHQNITISQDTLDVEKIEKEVINFLDAMPTNAIYRLKLTYNHLRDYEMAELLENDGWRNQLNFALEKNKQWIDEISVDVHSLDETMHSLIDLDEDIWQEVEHEVLSDTVFFELISDLSEKHYVPRRDFFDEEYREQLLEKARMKLLK